MDRLNTKELLQEFSVVEIRNKPTPIYNCNGLTFASRRTQIWKSNEIRKILRDDSYVEIRENEVLPGDVILYVGDKGDIEHSGIVISKPDKDFKIPFVVSKWGKGPECIHNATVCPYNQLTRKYYRVKDGN